MAWIDTVLFAPSSSFRHFGLHVQIRPLGQFCTPRPIRSNSASRAFSRAIYTVKFSQTDRFGFLARHVIRTVSVSSDTLPICFYGISRTVIYSPPFASSYSFWNLHYTVKLTARRRVPKNLIKLLEINLLERFIRIQRHAAIHLGQRLSAKNNQAPWDPVRPTQPKKLLCTPFRPLPTTQAPRAPFTASVASTRSKDQAHRGKTSLLGHHYYPFWPLNSFGARPLHPRPTGDQGQFTRGARQRGMKETPNPQSRPNGPRVTRKSDGDETKTGERRQQDGTQEDRPHPSETRLGFWDRPHSRGVADKSQGNSKLARLLV